MELSAQGALNISNAVEEVKHRYNEERAMDYVMQSIRSQAEDGFEAVHIKAYRINDNIVKRLEALGYTVELQDGVDDEGFSYKVYWVYWGESLDFTIEDMEKAFT